MAKRFIDTGIFKKKWFRELDPAMKTVWLYLFTNCDHAGIIDADYGLMSYMIGQEITNLDELNGNVIEVEDKWYLTKFNEFQYGELNPENRVHQSVLLRLSKFGLIDNVSTVSKCIEDTKNKPLISPLQGLKDKDKDKDKEKDKDKGFEKFWNLYDRKVNKPKTLLRWNKLTQKDRAAIFEHLPEYIKSTPDKQFRKHPMTYLNNRGWEDEIVTEKSKPKFKKTKTGLFKAWCSRCGKKEFPNNEYQIKEGSSCCSVEYRHDDPNLDEQWVKNKIKRSIK